MAREMILEPPIAATLVTQGTSGTAATVNLSTTIKARSNMGQRFAYKCDQDCYLVWGTSGLTAVTITTGIFLLKGDTVAFTSKLGKTDFLSVIQSTAAGTLTIWPIGY